MPLDEAIGAWVDDDPDDDDGYDDARCPFCGAGADENCAMDCGDEDDENDLEFL